MAIAYKAVELAEACYIFEVTHWIALKQLPEFSPDENGNEVRVDPKAHDDHYEPLFDSSPFLTEEEIAAFLPDIEPEKYIAAQIDCYGRTSSEIRISLEEFLQRFTNENDDDLHQMLKEHKEKALAEADSAEWLEATSKPIFRLLDQAKAKVFLALSEGSLKATGYALKLNEEDGYQYCERVDIPPEAWTLDSIDWTLAATKVDGAEIRCAHVSTEEMLREFPLSEADGTQLSGIIAGSTFIPSKSSKTQVRPSSIPRNRGRPKLANGIIETAVRNEFRRLKATGGLSEKKEANIQLMIDWAQNILGKEVARSNIQRWIDQSEGLPNNDAQN